MRGTWARAAAAAVVVVGIAGCSAPAADLSVCAEAPDEVVAALQERVDEGTLRFGQQTEGDEGVKLISAELHLPDDDEDDDGDILTWATLDPASGVFVAVDERAREDSEWPQSDELDVRDDGAIESRACTAEMRNTTTTTLDEDSTTCGPDVPAAFRRNCE